MRGFSLKFPLSFPGRSCLCLCGVHSPVLLFGKELGSRKAVDPPTTEGVYMKAQIIHKENLAPLPSGNMKPVIYCLRGTC